MKNFVYEGHRHVTWPVLLMELMRLFQEQHVKRSTQTGWERKNDESCKAQKCSDQFVRQAIPINQQEDLV